MNQKLPFGSDDLRLPDELRGPLLDHLASLRERYAARKWGGRMGFGARPAVVVIDFALGWTRDRGPMGSNLDSVVEATCRVLAAARAANTPIFFTTGDADTANPSGPGDLKLPPLDAYATVAEDRFDLDPRLERRPNEKIIRKPYASVFKGTNFQDMLTMSGVDTLIVTGCSTSHCVYATCRDARDCFHVIVPEEAVGERCELMHLVNLLDIDIDLGDVMPTEDVVSWLER